MSATNLLVKLSKKSAGKLSLSVLLGFSSAIFNGIGITLVIPLVLSFLGINVAQSGNLPPLLESLFSILENISDSYRALVMIGTIMLMIVLKNLTNYASAITSGLLSRHFSANLRVEGIRLLLDVDIQYFSEKRLGELMNSINAEVNRVSTAVKSLIETITSGISIFVFLIILVSISWQLTLAATILLSSIALISQLLIRYAKSYGRDLSATSAALSSRSIEILSGIRQVKSVANEDVEFDTLVKLIRDRERASYQSQVVSSAVAPVNEVISILAVIALVFIGRLMFASQLETFSSIILTYLFILTRMLPFLGKINTARNQLANSASSIEILENFLDRDSKPLMSSGNQIFEKLSSKIEFCNLWFRYPNSEKWALQGIDITLPKGQTLALVGSSGAGKSTMADLLARFYDPEKGVIKIDGIDLKDFSLPHYRSKIGIVSQDTFLFNASVLDNIKYGRPEATDQAVFQAAKQANATEFIENLEEGFSTKIGDRGVMLSGGQRQRIAIARALLQNPEILILDEATSALDTISERLVQEALEKLSQQRTTLVIAHRLSTVQKADQIVVLDKGEVVEVGTHNELLSKEGIYASLHGMQFSDYPIPDGIQSSFDSQEHRKNIRQASHEIRSKLGGMIYILGLLDDDVSNLSEDGYEEIADRSYQSAISILESLEKLERVSLAER